MLSTGTHYKDTEQDFRLQHHRSWCQVNTGTWLNNHIFDFEIKLWRKSKGYFDEGEDFPACSGCSPAGRQFVWRASLVRLSRQESSDLDTMLSFSYRKTFWARTKGRRKLIASNLTTTYRGFLVQWWSWCAQDFMYTEDSQFIWRRISFFIVSLQNFMSGRPAYRAELSWKFLGLWKGAGHLWTPTNLETGCI